MAARLYQYICQEKYFRVTNKFFIYSVIPIIKIIISTVIPYYLLDNEHYSITSIFMYANATNTWISIILPDN